jgi:murein L,D-transpeptidase YcbB/YkuD
VVGTTGDDEVDPASIDWSDESATRKIRLRQRPGDDNALGLVKFIFPNNFNVYLHDTPSDRLFFKERRCLSPRLHPYRRPDRDGELRDARSAGVDGTADPKRHVGAGQEQTVKLKTPIPVHIGYWTAWVEPDGKTVTYTDDPYKIDPAQAELLKK